MIDSGLKTLSFFVCKFFEKNVIVIGMKDFNVTGTCFPDQHYMLDISDRLAQIKAMVDKGNYFCINKGRQYGKTTTLSLSPNALADDYCVFSISFEGL